MLCLHHSFFLRKFAFSLSVFTVLFNLYAFCQQEQYNFRHLDINHGLSDHEISCIYRDRKGFVWVGTNFGLNRCDGYSVRIFLNTPHDSTSLVDNGVKEIFETPDGQIAVLTPGGLALYDPTKEAFQRNLTELYTRYGTSKELKNIIHSSDGAFWFVEPKRIVWYNPESKKSIPFYNIQGDTATIINEVITHCSADGKGNAWIVHANGIAEKLTVKNNTGRVSDRIYSAYNFNRRKQANYKLISDEDGDLWFNVPNFFQGILYYNLNTKKLHQIDQNSSEFKLNTNKVSDIIEVKDGIWVGTDHGGINVINKRKKTVRYILHRDEDPRSISESAVRRFYRDREGFIWVGTFKRGVSYYHEKIYLFDVYKHNSLDASSLPNQDINSFEEDAKGNLWIGTNGGGLVYFDRKAGTFKQYLNEPGNSNSLSSNVVVSLWMDAEQNLWIGAYKGGLNKFDGKKFTRYNPIPGDTTSLISQNIWDLFEDSKGRFWIGTIDEGAAIMNRKTGKFHRIVTHNNTIRSSTIEAITEDRKGRIWFGTTVGIDVLSPDGSFTHYETSATPNSLSNSRVLDILEDSKGRIWAGTKDGLNLYIDSLKGFKVFRHQLPHPSIMDIREDAAGRLWMSTLNGLCEMKIPDANIDQATFQHYVESDGLQGMQFNPNAAYKTRKGELIFGGPTGFNIFTPTKNDSIPVKPKVVFTGLKLNQKPIYIGERVDGIVVLPNSISELSEITLPPHHNFFSLQFSSLNFFNPEKTEYVYKLEGLNQEWLPVETGNHEISFSGLHPGEYKLRMKTIDGNNVWSKNETVLSVIIQPPFWRTKTAMALYIVFLIGMLYIARRIIQQREKLKFAVEQERQEIHRIQELDLLKVRFFTNVSHEFRTPLTLILTPIERLIKRTTDPELLNQFQLIDRNGKRLMKLVNQLLDFKKLEVHEIYFTPTAGNIVDFVRDTTISFSDLAEKKNIALEFKSSVAHLETLFDADKLEKILFNLLSNSFKFTLENGAVMVRLDELTTETTSLVQIQVSDTGIGIPADKLDRIFEPFFQSDIPKSMINQGSGIGLSLTREFVRIHGGTIHVISEAGKGSTFIVQLPLAKVHTTSPSNESISDAEVINPDSLAPDEQREDKTEGQKKTILLIEDDDDVRFYLKDNLKFQYKIFQAKNGGDGWEKILSLQPDLVVSDIMMAEFDGIELCTKIKSDARVSHIPVILLTARSSEQQRVEGLKAGADDYITKPFSFEVLEARISNLLMRQQRSQNSVRKTLDVKASELQITPLDEKFIANAIKCVEQHVSSPEFSVEDLGEELGISRAYVFKKILALTGKTPLEFIRSIRLQHAVQLLEKSQLSVREVAYKVGYNNPKYFTKHFKDQFGELPSAFAASQKKKR
jgi:signal transduction histidine kinase/ligand-binding sensor domain-containing protein/DNA-binding response OmpR family regulator